METAALARRLGAAVKKAGTNKRSGWFTSHMAAASRAIMERVPLVDFTLEVRDARIPISSAYEDLRHFSSSSMHIIVLNKMDLADRLQTQAPKILSKDTRGRELNKKASDLGIKKWLEYFGEQNCICYGINSHNKDNIKVFLNFLQARVRELNKLGQPKHTITMMLVGIPNVGKSALANSLHQIGRISAAEKGRLKHAIVSPVAGETKDISSLKIASHPNIYVLDTPGVLPTEILDAEVGAKLALTGAIKDCLVEEQELARYFLAILNSSDAYKDWKNLPSEEVERSSEDHKAKLLGIHEADIRRRKQYPTDHTQDFVVRSVRRTLFETVSSFKENLENEEKMGKLIEAQFVALREVFHVPLGSDEDGIYKVAKKLLNLYRTGRLGHYTLDDILRNGH
ncbi:DAR GTPase 2, mitochondrial isoform X3 [Macadamia integrifolia]|uniref:DAR GTPase 2, mitochondrial isoform X3 n=1 Tax=Macadamia integrifolia TaxID=60698 RepID=UPI001C4F066D|nr:DAR GTPase 2, mitochondrial isoform X3 [Macadamia integrifolia]